MFSKPDLPDPFQSKAPTPPSDSSQQPGINSPGFRLQLGQKFDPNEQHAPWQSAPNWQSETWDEQWVKQQVRNRMIRNAFFLATIIGLVAYSAFVAYGYVNTPFYQNQPIVFSKEESKERSYVKSIQPHVDHMVWMYDQQIKQVISIQESIRNLTKTYPNPFPLEKSTKVDQKKDQKPNQKSTTQPKPVFIQSKDVLALRDLLMSANPSIMQITEEDRRLDEVMLKLKKHIEPPKTKQATDVHRKLTGVWHELLIRTMDLSSPLKTLNDRLKSQEPMDVKTFYLITNHVQASFDWKRKELSSASYDLRLHMRNFEVFWNRTHELPAPADLPMPKATIFSVKLPTPTPKPSVKPMVIPNKDVRIQEPSRTNTKSSATKKPKPTATPKPEIQYEDPNYQPDLFKF